MTKITSACSLCKSRAAAAEKRHIFGEIRMRNGHLCCWPRGWVKVGTAQAAG